MKPAASISSRRFTLWESGVWQGVSDPTEGYLHASCTPPLDLKCGVVIQWILGSVNSQGLVESGLYTCWWSGALRYPSHRDETAGSWHTGPQECGQGGGGSSTLQPHEMVV